MISQTYIWHYEQVWQRPPRCPPTAPFGSCHIGSQTVLKVTNCLNLPMQFRPRHIPWSMMQLMHLFLLPGKLIDDGPGIPVPTAIFPLLAQSCTMCSQPHLVLGAPHLPARLPFTSPVAAPDSCTVHIYPSRCQAEHNFSPVPTITQPSD